MRVKILAAVVALVFTGAAAAAAQQDAAPRFAIRTVPEVVVGGTAAATVLLGELLAARLPHATCAPCDRSALLGIDRAVLGPQRQHLSAVSDALLLGTIAGAGLMLYGERGGARSAALEDVAVMIQAVSVDAAVTTLLKLLIRRPRPVRYDTAAAPFATADDGRSFPSHHASMAAAAAAAYVAIHYRRGDLRRHRGRAMLLAGTAAVTTALRVASRRHFPTDALAGAALGAASGWLVTMSVPLR